MHTFGTHKESQSSQGFTLVELAIALMVIGLLIGGVLKGQELIENARITATVREIKAYDAATLIFKNTYGALPGDIKKTNRIPNCTSSPCNIAGNGDGKIDPDFHYWGGLGSQPQEVYNFFPHMTRAGMIKGPEGNIPLPTNFNGGSSSEISPENDSFFPLLPIDQYIMVYHTHAGDGFDGGGIRKNRFDIGGIGVEDGEAEVPTRTMMQIDTKMDDGRPYTGDVRMSTLIQCPDAPSATSEYDLEGLNDVCPLRIGTQF